jgi:hypothetical protein
MLQTSPLAEMWQLKLSPGKCSVLNIGTIQFPNDYIMGGINLPMVDYITDLGFEIDSKQSKQHINKTCTRAK